MPFLKVLRIMNSSLNVYGGLSSKFVALNLVPVDQGDPAPAFPRGREVMDRISCF